MKKAPALPPRSPELVVGGSGLDRDLGIAFGLTIDEADDAACLCLTFRAASAVDRHHQVKQKHRRLLADRPMKMLGEVVAIGVDGLCEGRAFCGVGRSENGFERLKHFVQPTGLSSDIGLVLSWVENQVRPQSFAHTVNVRDGGGCGLVARARATRFAAIASAMTRTISRIMVPASERKIHRAANQAEGRRSRRLQEGKLARELPDLFPRLGIIYVRPESSGDL